MNIYNVHSTSRVVILYFITLLLLISLTDLHSQNNISANLRKENPLGLSFYAGGASITGFSLNYFVIPNIDLEVTAGFNFSGGVKYHFLAHRPISWSPFVGVIANAKGSLGSDFDTRRGFYVPIGVNYISSKLFSLTIEAGTWYIIDDDNDPSNTENESGFHPWGGIKIGIQISK